MKKPSKWWLLGVVAASMSLSPAAAHTGHGETSATWHGDPCTEPVLLIETDLANVAAHIPNHFPGTDEEFLSNVVSYPGADGEPKATVVMTLNRCAGVNEIESRVHGRLVRTASGNDWAEVLVMVLYDGPSENAFEFYALADYVDDPRFASAFRSLGLPTQHTPGLVFDLPANPLEPEPGAVVPFTVEIPNTFAVDGEVVRPAAFDTGGHATHYFHGPRGFVMAEHDTPIGGMSFVSGTLTVTGPRGRWIADLLGTSDPVPVSGFYLEKTGGHNHAAVLQD